MSADLVTRLVVGQSISVDLGRRIRSSGDEGLQLQNGRWVAIGAAAKFLERLRKHTEPELPKLVTLGAPASVPPSEGRAAVTPRRGRKAFVVGALALALVAAGAVTYLALLRGTPTPVAKPAPSTLPLPIPAPSAPDAPQAQSAPQAVQIVAAPYDPNGPVLPLASPDGAPVDAQAPVPSAVLKPAPQAQTPAKPAPPQPPAMRAGDPKLSEAKAADKPRPAAVVLDDAPQIRPQAQAPLAPPTASVQPPAAASRPDKSSAAAVTPPAAAVAKPATLPRGAGLVAIPPDGKSAVFTNTKTRLPEQFKVGDLLPNGETVKAIDVKEGRVVTNAKEYHLD